MTSNSWISSAVTASTNVYQNISFAPANPAPKGGDKVDINVPPAKNITAADAAKELRVLLKELYAEQKQKAVPAVSAAATKITPTTEQLDGINSLRAERDELSLLVTKLIVELDTLVEISKKRRPSEIKKKVIDMKAGTVLNLNTHLRRTSEWISFLRPRLNQAVAAPPPIPPPLNSVGRLERAYALIQAIPTIESPPVGKDATTIRAIKAMLKVHEGVDPLAGYDAVAMPDGMPFVVVHEIPVPVVAVPPVRYKAPFRIGSKTQASYDPGTIRMANYTVLNCAADVDGIGSVKNWNGGDCTVEQAAETYRAFCNRYSTKGAFLKDVDGTILAERPRPKEPIVWNIPVPAIA